MATLKIKLVKSLNGRLDKHIATANSLGLRRIGENHRDSCCRKENEYFFHMSKYVGFRL